MAAGVKRQGCVKRPAGDQVAGSAAGQTGIEAGVVLGRCGRGERDVDVRMVPGEGWKDDAGPDVPVVTAPAFDPQGLRPGVIHGQQEGCPRQDQTNQPNTIPRHFERLPSNRFFWFYRVETTGSQLFEVSCGRAVTRVCDVSVSYSPIRPRSINRVNASGRPVAGFAAG